MSTTAPKSTATGCAPDGTTAWPMRLADTQNTMALVQLQRGDLDDRLADRALHHDRKSIPSLLRGTSDLVVALERRHPREPAVHAFRERVAEICRELRGRRAPAAA